MVPPTHSQLWLGEEELLPGLGGGDINHRKHLSGWHLELKENTWQKGRTSHPRLWGLGDHHYHAGRLSHLRFRLGNPEKGPCHGEGEGQCLQRGWDNASSGSSPCWGTRWACVAAALVDRAAQGRTAGRWGLEFQFVLPWLWNNAGSPPHGALQPLLHLPVLWTLPPWCLTSASVREGSDPPSAFAAVLNSPVFSASFPNSVAVTEPLFPGLLVSIAPPAPLSLPNPSIYFSLPSTLSLFSMTICVTSDPSSFSSISQCGSLSVCPYICTFLSLFPPPTPRLPIRPGPAWSKR